MRYRITTPEPDWTGTIGTVAFARGAAECEADDDAAALRYFRAQGYGVEPLDDQAAEVEDLRAKAAEVDQLRAKAAELDGLRARAAEVDQLRAKAAELDQLRAQATAAGAEPGPPAETAGKPAWVTWALAQNQLAPKPLPDDDVRAMTKPELVDRFGKKAGDQQ